MSHSMVSIPPRSSSFPIPVQASSIKGCWSVSCQAEKQPRQVRPTHGREKHSHLLWALYTFQFTWLAWLWTVEGNPPGVLWERANRTAAFESWNLNLEPHCDTFAVCCFTTSLPSVSTESPCRALLKSTLSYFRSLTCQSTRFMHRRGSLRTLKGLIYAIKADPCFIGKGEKSTVCARCVLAGELCLNVEIMR